MTADTTAPTWETVAAAKQAAREALIPAEWRIEVPKDVKNVTSIPASCGLLSADELKITETPAPALVEAMSTGQLTSEAVVTAFAKRAAIAHQLTNCLTEIFFTKGIERAKALDEEFKRTGKPAGPLHGLPISLKDNIAVHGYDSTVGFIAFANQPAEEPADIVTTLLDAGAVIFCKTNVPTGMLMGETYNNVWGYTPNPYNTAYGSGGSSGGEAALLALRGAPLGVGTDIGGSIRMPAAICGIYGLKAAGGRFSSLGLKAGLPGQEAIKSVSGPMSADLESLELYSRVILDAKPWERDPAVFPVPWKEIAVPEKLAFGLLLDDGLVRPTPAVRRVLLETKAALEAAGHTVIEWTPYDAPAGNQLLMRFLMGDGGVKMRSIVRGGEIPEPWPLQLEPFEQLYNMFKDNLPTVGGLWELQVQRQVYLRQLYKSFYDSREVTGTGRPFDGIISPATAFPAAPRYTFRHAGYTGLWNLADWTGVAFPAGWASKDDVKEDGFEGRNADEKDIWEKYDPVELDGMPVGLQLIVPRHNEELALKLAGVAAGAIKAYKQE